MSCWKESSRFISETTKTSTSLMIYDARNWNSFLTEFMLISAKMGRLRFSSHNDFKLTVGNLFFSLSLSTCLFDRLHFLLQIASSSFSTIFACRSSFQFFLIRSKKITAKCCDPDSFKCKPLPLKCLLLIFTISTMLIFDCSRCLANW